MNDEIIVVNDDEESSLKLVKNYFDFTNSNRQNVKVKGIDFTLNQFENLIDCWTPKETIMTILRTNHTTLDKFCKTIYKMDFNETYDMLTGVTNAFMSKTIRNLANGGNSTALNIVTDHFMKLKKEEESKAINIKIVNDLQDDDI